jgi:hypothetical protein
LCKKKERTERLLVEWEERRERDKGEKRCDFFSHSLLLLLLLLLLPANKIDRIQNVATKNPLARKTRESERERAEKQEKKKKKKRTHTFTNTHRHQHIHFKSIKY